jgi:hypothetical protein
VNWNKEILERVIIEGEKDKKYQTELEILRTEKAENDQNILHHEEGSLFRKLKLWVPTGLRSEICESEHDTKVASHMGQDKIKELIRRNFWWPGMNEQIVKYIQSCPECQRNKAALHKSYGLLYLLELAFSPWSSIAMESITDLPLSDGCDQVWVIIDHFTKMVHFIPLKKNEKQTENLALVFAREIWRLDEIPTDMVSDWDSRFISKFWKAFLMAIGVKPRMSTAFQPETDGQTERVNQTIEAFLRAFVNLEMRDWVELLPMAEFASNNSRTTATGHLPFYANYGFHPNSGVTQPRTDTLLVSSKAYGHWMMAIHEDCPETLEKSREVMKRYADRDHTEAPKY